MTELSTLLPLRSAVTIRTTIYTRMGAAGVTVSGLSSASILRALPEITAELEAEGEIARVEVAKGGWLSGAESLTRPEWLYLLAEDNFGLTVDPALATLGYFRVTATASASASTIGTGKLVVRYGTGSSARYFENTEGFAPALGSYVEVPMKAQVAGAAGNLGNNATLVLVTSYPGLTVTNPTYGTPAVTWITRRGRDIEVMSSLAGRCRERWADLAEGTSSERFARLVRKAFEAAGQTNPITRIYVDDANPLGPGSVALYMARDSIPATAEDVALVDAYVGDRWSAGRNRFKSYAAAILTITISGSIKGPSDSAAALVQADAALQALAPRYPIGGATVYAEQPRSAMMTGTTGALNVVLDLAEQTPIPPGSIVAFVLGTVTVTP
jgi:hypothetical protein